MREPRPDVQREAGEFDRVSLDKEILLRDVSLDGEGPSSSVGSDTPRASNSLSKPLVVKTTAEPSRQVVRWKDLPRKGQLTVLTLARLSEPLVQTSIQVSPVSRLLL